MSRDFQQSKVYAAENALQWFYDHVPHCSVNVNGVPLQLEPEARFGDLEGIQAYCDRVVVNPAVVAMFGVKPAVTVRERKGDRAAHYRAGVIAINSKSSAWSSGSGWGLRETVVIHELAHHYAGTGCGHGPKFTATHLKLLGILLGPQAAMAQRIIYDMEGVK